MHFVVLCDKGVLALLFVCSFRLEAGLGKRGRGGVVDAYPTSAARADDR